MNGLESYRKKIDQLDNQLLELISKRGELAKEIGKLKQKKGGAILAPSREAAIYDRLEKNNQGPFKTEAIKNIFGEIISATRALEAPLKISFLGPSATFTNMAAVRHFGRLAQMVPETGLQNVFASVEKRHTDFGVVPIENTTEGVVNHTLDLFVDSPLKICSEVVLQIRHHLLSNEKDLSKIKIVYSHAQALAQCRQWLALHLPKAELIETVSTSAAAKRVASEKGAAAVASEMASQFYHVAILQADIQDLVQNYTRFLVVGNITPPPTGSDKTSILFVARDQPGILYKILSPLAKAKINLTKIESRPIKKRAWEYMFFVDLDGHADTPKIAKVLKQVQNNCTFFKILGAYPTVRQGV